MYDLMHYLWSECLLGGGVYWSRTVGFTRREVRYREWVKNMSVSNISFTQWSTYMVSPCQFNTYFVTVETFQFLEKEQNTFS